MTGKIKILGGTVRGQWLYSPSGPETRPASSRLRDSLFNILGPTIAGQQVLDLFAGTGSLGLEALSRGASRCVFIEYNRKALVVLKKNITKLKFQESATAVFLNALKIIPAALKKEWHFDLVFVDPPYKILDDLKLKKKLFAALDELPDQGVLAPGGRVLIEYRQPQVTENEFENLSAYDFREYGQTAVRFFRNKVF